MDIGTATNLARATGRPVERRRIDGTLRQRIVPCLAVDPDDGSTFQYNACEVYARDGYACCELAPGHQRALPSAGLPADLEA